MRKTILRTISCLALILVAFSAAAALQGGSPFTVIWDEQPVELKPGTSFRLGVTIRAPEGYYLYADETDVDFASLEGLLISDIRYPKSKPYVDPVLGKKVEVYSGDVSIAIEGRVPESMEPGDRELTALVRFRGCSPTLCYRPEEREVGFRMAVLTPVAGERVVQRPAELKSEPELAPIPVTLPERLGLKGLLEVRDFSELLDRGVPVAAAIVLLAGILTSLTPCVWPVIPLVLLFVGVHPSRRFRDNLSLAATLVSGIVLTYSLLGVGAVAFGKNLGFLFQQRWFLVLIVAFFVAMSLSMFGVFDIRMPRGWHARLHRLGGKGHRGAFLAGMGMGLLASPCSGPVIAALLGYVALQGNYLLGFLLTVIYGCGMGVFIVLLGAGYGELAGKLRGGSWMLWIKRALGIILLFPAFFYVGSLFSWSMPGGSRAESQWMHVEWLSSEPDALHFARQTGKPIMVEFTASWCPPCTALERNFFSRSDVAALSFELVPLRIDASKETPEVRRLISKYRVVGWPTVLFLAPDGSSYEDLRVGEYAPSSVERGMREAVQRAGRP